MIKITDVTLQALADNSENELQAQLAKELLHVRGVARKHMGAEGHDSCWENDQELWREVLGEEARGYPHDKVPPFGEFMGNCSKYWASRSPVPIKILKKHEALELRTKTGEPRYLLIFSAQNIEDAEFSQHIGESIVKSLAEEGVAALAVVLPCEVDLTVSEG